MNAEYRNGVLEGISSLGVVMGDKRETSHRSVDPVLTEVAEFISVEPINLFLHDKYTYMKKFCWQINRVTRIVDQKSFWR